jgi:hypothetical protein
MRFLQSLQLALACLLSLSGAAYAADESLVTQLMERRAALVEQGRIDVPAMSMTIKKVVTDTERLEKLGQYQEALTQLRTLEQYGDLTQIPSHNVQMLASWLYMKTGNKEQAAVHTARADAMRTILDQRIGSGRTGDDPVRVVMAQEISEWVQMRLARLVGVKPYDVHGQQLLAVTYQGGFGMGQEPATAYFLVDPRVRAKMMEGTRLFRPIPLSELNAEHRAALEQARASRERFLTDRHFPYLELQAKIRTALQEAKRMMATEPAQAMAALREIETLRPIEDIPSPDLITMYSYLTGRTGDPVKQAALREKLFGIQQAIAHSGDALSAGTAIPVLFISEEYEWLRDMRLITVRQEVVDSAGAKFDVITARDQGGQERKYWFDITRMYARYDLAAGSKR